MNRVFADLASEHAEATVLLTDDEEIARLNETYRGVAGPTDVLSFAYQEAEDAVQTPDLLGDIVISVETASRYAASGEHAGRVGEPASDEPWSLLDELSFLIIHGALHLCGYDHGTAAEERQMVAEEARLWALVAPLSAKWC